MNNLYKCLLLFGALSLLSACVHTKIIDEVVLMDAMGFDYVKEGQIRETILSTVYLEDQPPKNITETAISDTKKLALYKISEQTPFHIGRGGIDVILFGEELAAKEGILKLLDPFQRDPSVGANLTVGIVDGEAKDFLEGEYGIRGNSKFITELVDHNIKHENLPKTNLQHFLHAFYQQGQTPFLPRFKKISKTKMKLQGVYLIKHGKIADTIPDNEMFFFKLLVDKYSNGFYQIEVDEGKAAVRSIRSKHKMKLVGRNPYSIQIHIKVYGIINEFTGNELKPETIKEVEKQFEKIINEKCEELIRRFQEKELDPIGLGHFVRSKTRNFDYDKWRTSDYANLTVKVSSSVKIMSAGTIE